MTTKYGIVINQIKFGTIAHIPQMYNTEEEAQKQVDKDIQETFRFLNTHYKEHFKIEKIKHIVGGTTFYSNYIMQDDKIAFCYVILKFDTKEII